VVGCRRQGREDRAIPGPRAGKGRAQGRDMSGMRWCLEVQTCGFRAGPDAWAEVESAVEIEFAQATQAE
jgi:hypothetical protein